MNAPNPYARWEYREDRFELMHWLRAPRRGYRLWQEPNTAPGTVRLEVRRRVERRARHLPGQPVVFQRYYPALFELPIMQLAGPPEEWRAVVADALRQCRRFLRDLRPVAYL